MTFIRLHFWPGLDAGQRPDPEVHRFIINDRNRGNAGLRFSPDPTFKFECPVQRKLTSWIGHVEVRHERIAVGNDWATRKMTVVVGGNGSIGDRRVKSRGGGNCVHAQPMTLVWPSIALH